MGNEGTARLWRWADHAGPGDPRTAPLELSAPEVDSLTAWPEDSTGVMAVSGRMVRRVTPAPEPITGTTFDLVEDLFVDSVSEQERAVDPDGSLQLLAWDYTGHVKPDVRPGPTGWALSVPYSQAVWHRIAPGGPAGRTKGRPWLPWTGPAVPGSQPRSHRSGTVTASLRRSRSWPSPSSHTVSFHGASRVEPSRSCRDPLIGMGPVQPGVAPRVRPDGSGTDQGSGGQARTSSRRRVRNSRSAVLSVSASASS